MRRRHHGPHEQSKSITIILFQLETKAATARGEPTNLTPEWESEGMVPPHTSSTCTPSTGKGRLAALKWSRMQHEESSLCNFAPKSQ